MSEKWDVDVGWTLADGSGGRLLYGGGGPAGCGNVGLAAVDEATLFALMAEYLLWYSASSLLNWSESRNFIGGNAGLVLFTESMESSDGECTAELTSPGARACR